MPREESGARTNITWGTARGLQVSSFEILRQTEIGDLDDTGCGGGGVGAEEVFWLQVPVHHTMLVHVVDSLEDLAHQSGGVVLTVASTFHDLFGYQRRRMQRDTSKEEIRRGNKGWGSGREM
jgi:hypothetical protein